MANFVITTTTTRDKLTDIWQKNNLILLSDVPCLRHVVVHNKPHLPGKQVKIIVVTPVFTESDRYRLLIRWSIDLRRGEGHITRISDYDVKVEIGI